MTLGELISKFREDHNLSMDKFAEMSGLSKGYISMLERNSNPKTGKPITPTLNTFAAVADAMNMDLNTIIRVVDANQKINLGKDNNLDQQQEFTSASEAMKWLLEQNVIMAYGGVDLERLSDEEKIDYANEVLNQLRLVGYKYKKE